MGSTGTKVDMGASWIHGIGPGAGDLDEYKTMENPLYSIAKANNITTKMTWSDSEQAEESSYWWKSPTTSISSTRIKTMEDGVRKHVSKKKDSATQS